MTIVGPRPERPEIAEEYEKVMPEFRLRLQAKAGLTGYAQVYGKYNTTPYDKLLMDLMYISEMWLEFREKRGRNLSFTIPKFIKIMENVEQIDG